MPIVDDLFFRKLRPDSLIVSILRLFGHGLKIGRGNRLKTASGKYELRDVIYYIVKKLDHVDGLKKLMKLIFLVQYDAGILPSRVVKYLYNSEPLTRTEFYIWQLGPYSDDVYDIVYNDDNIVLKPDEYGRTIIKLKHDVEIVLPEEVKNRINRILRKYCNWSGTKLEHYTLKKILKFELVEEKEDWYGVPVDECLRRRGISIREVDLAET